MALPRPREFPGKDPCCRPTLLSYLNIARRRTLCCDVICTFVAMCGLLTFMKCGFVDRDDVSATCLLLPACSCDDLWGKLMTVV